MSLQHTNRTMTGRIRGEPRVSLGKRRSGRAGVTIHLDYDSYGCYDDAKVIEQLIADLEQARLHLMQNG